MIRISGAGFLMTFAGMLASGATAIAFDYSFDVPPPAGQPALATYGMGVSNNGGYDVGFAVNATNTATVGFERLANGTIISPIVAPGDNASYTRALGVNNSGTVVGDFLTVTGGTSTYHGFFLSNGNFTQFDVGGPVSTTISSINDAGNIVGTFGSSVQANEGFVKIGGTLSEFTIAGATSLYGYAINDNNQVVGDYTDASGASHGYVRSASGVLTPFDVPGAASTYAYGINDAGTIVGTYKDASGVYHGYIRNGSVITTFSVFGTTAAEPLGINDLGQVTGAYEGSDGATHGFLTNPASVPEPSSLAMLGLGLGSLLAWLRRRER